MVNVVNNLYPEIKPFASDLLKVSTIHSVYYEECGNPIGAPVIFLHGGPGSGCNPTQRRFFDPAHYRIILMDQRGCGRSTPAGETAENTTDDLVADIETLRQHLNIARWHVFGGSWGSTLALAYALKHTSRVVTLNLRGIFLSRASELNWFLGDVAHFYPEVWQKLVNYLPAHQQENVLNGFEAAIFNDDLQISAPSATAWNAYESAIMRLKPVEDQAEAKTETNAETKQKTPQEITEQSKIEVARARVQIHYIKHQCFIDGEAMLIDAAKLKDVPTNIVQGRYDMVCPPQTAWALQQAMPHAKLVMVADAGHSAMEIGVTSALIEASDAFRSIPC